MQTSCMEAHAVWTQLGDGSGGGTQKERANRLRLVPPFHRKGAAAGRSISRRFPPPLAPNSVTERCSRLLHLLRLGCFCLDRFSDRP